MKKDYNLVDANLQNLLLFEYGFQDYSLKQLSAIEVFRRKHPPHSEKENQVAVP